MAQIAHLAMHAINYTKKLLSSSYIDSRFLRVFVQCQSHQK